MAIYTSVEKTLKFPVRHSPQSVAPGYCYPGVTGESNSQRHCERPTGRVAIPDTVLYRTALGLPRRHTTARNDFYRWIPRQLPRGMTVRCLRGMTRKIKLYGTLDLSLYLRHAGDR